MGELHSIMHSYPADSSVIKSCRRGSQITDRNELLLVDFIAETRLTVLKEPAFQNFRGSSYIDVTMGSERTGSKVCSWKIK